MGTVISYTIGLLLSIILTMMTYIIVVNHWLPDWANIVIMALAAVQMIVQLVFFLHLTSGPKPRWNLAAFWFMFIMLLVIVVGSLWIMDNLNYNMMMTPEEMTQYMIEQNKKGF